MTTVEIDEETFEEIIKVGRGSRARRVPCSVQLPSVHAPQGPIVQSLWDSILCPLWSCLCCRWRLCFDRLACHLQTNKRMVPYLFVRGDGVILISPPLRT